MLRRVRIVALESIDGVGRRWPDVGLETLTAQDINRPIKQFRDVILERDVFLDADRRSRVDLNHNIDIAVGPVVTARARTKHSRD